MIGTVPDILARIVARKREESARRGGSTTELERQAKQKRPALRGFRKALLRRSPAIIAEIKKASPSKGVLREEFDPAAIARQYEQGGAAALSVLTDGPFFQGSLDDLEAARAACALPALRKDFTLEERDVIEAAARGADAILLIAAILEERQIRDFRELAARCGMDALVEAHDERELEMAIAAGADIVGVNNRDLKTFEVTLETSLRLAPKIPKSAVAVSESGIDSPDAIRRLSDAGFRAFLIGEHLLKTASPVTEIKRLAGLR